MGMFVSSLIFIGFCLTSQLSKLTEHNRSISELFSMYKMFPREPHPLAQKKCIVMQANPTQSFCFTRKEKITRKVSSSEDICVSRGLEVGRSKVS